MDEPLKFGVSNTSLFGSAEPFLKNGEKWWLFSARAFKTGHYPDKGLDATPEWVKGIVQNTPAQVPVGFEHKDTMFDAYGLARDFHYDDSTGSVFCYVEMPDALKGAIEYVGVGGLSVFIDEGRIKALDVTPRPRVGTAKVFSADADSLETYKEVIEFAKEHGELDTLVSMSQSDRDKENAKKKEQEEVILMDETKVEEEVVEQEVTETFEETPETPVEDERLLTFEKTIADATTALDQKDARIAALEEKLAALGQKLVFSTDQQLDALVKEGKLAPAVLPYAKALCESVETKTLKFSEDSEEETLTPVELLSKVLTKSALFSRDDASGELEDEGSEVPAAIKRAIDEGLKHSPFAKVGE